MANPHGAEIATLGHLSEREEAVLASLSDRDASVILAKHPELLFDLGDNLSPSQIVRTLASVGFFKVNLPDDTFTGPVTNEVKGQEL